MKCDHAVVTAAEDLVRDETGCVLCPLCAGRCWVCGRVFHVDDLDAGACVECAAEESLAEVAVEGEEEKRGELGSMRLLGGELAGKTGRLETYPTLGRLMKNAVVEEALNNCEGVVEMKKKDVCENVRKAAEVKNGTGLARRAAEKLVELSAAEVELEALRERQAGLQGEVDEALTRIEGIRDELRGIVEGCGGVLDVEGLPRPLVVRRRRSFLYSEDLLAGWLRKHAPDYLTRTEGYRIDRRGLRRALVVRNGRAFLPGRRGPVRGVKVSEAACLAIPGAGADENERRR